MKHKQKCQWVDVDIDGVRYLVELRSDGLHVRKLRKEHAEVRILTMRYLICLSKLSLCGHC